MKRERRQPTRAEWRRITSSRPVVRRIPPPEKKPPGRNGETERREVPSVASCRVCSHRGVEDINEALLVARYSPRSMAKRYVGLGLSRTQLTRHYDVCLKDERRRREEESRQGTDEETATKGVAQ